MTAHRVVVTGVGAVSALGVGREAFWKAVCEGASADPAAARIEVTEFDAAAVLGQRGLRWIGRATRFTAAAARLALQDARFVEPAELGLAVGTAFGNTAETFEFTHRTLTEGVGEVLPMASFDAALNSQANFSAVFLEAQRFNKSLCGITASLEAIADAAAAIRDGRARAAVVVGVEVWSAELEEWLRYQRADSGPVSEGAYAVVLENAGAAARRGAPALAELGGAAQRFDAGGAASPARAVAELALGGERADLVVCCGAGDADPVAAQPPPLPLSVRSIAGESLGARGALGTAMAALALGTRCLPGGTPLPDSARVALVTDFEPGASCIALTLRSPPTIAP